MKIVCSQSDLLKAVNIVSKAVPARTTVTILECIKIDARENDIVLTASDTQLSIETRIEGTIEERGMVALNAKFFSEIVRSLTSNDVTIECDSSYKTKIICGKAKFETMGRSGEDFTALPLVSEEHPIVISQMLLRDIIQQTIFSISDSNDQKPMTGEQFKIEDNHLRIESLDGHRISIRNVLLNEDLNPEPVKYDVVVSGKSLNEVSKILTGGADDQVRIYISKPAEDTMNETRFIRFDFDKTKVVSTLLPGGYYNIDQMVSSEYQTKVRINRRELLDCINRANLLYTVEGKKEPFVIIVTDGLMELNIRTMNSSFDEKIEIEKEGLDINIAFNPKFLNDALRVIDDEEVTFYFINSKAPCSIKDDEETYIYIILPVNR